MDYILNLLIQTLGQVGQTLLHNWPYLLVSIILAALLKLYVNAEQVSAFLRRHRQAGVIAATTAAVATPLCSCGTTAVLLGMMASMMPWAPIVAFMVSSPLTSPGELFYSAGLFGWPFALAFFLASIVLGLAGGLAASILDSRGWLNNQVRFAEASSAEEASKLESACACEPARVPAAAFISLDQLAPAACCAASPAAVTLPLLPTTCCPAQPERLSRVETGQPCGSESYMPAPHAPTRPDFPMLLKEIYATGKRLLWMFIGFAFIGYFLNGLIPDQWVVALFGNGHAYRVPLAATLGLPFYINTEASLPLVRAMLDAGMSQGAALAFMISGAGTSMGAIAGALTIARWRVVGLVVGILWVGAILCGLTYDLLVGFGLF